MQIWLLSALFQFQSSTIYCCRVTSKSVCPLIQLLSVSDLLFILVDNYGLMSEPPLTEQSLITAEKTGPCLRLLSKIDIFSFIPFPRDDAVSTKKSGIASIVFLAIFLAYVLSDFIQFVVWNKPITQSYRSPLDDSSYVVPDFAIAFMTTNQSQDINNYTQLYDDLFTYEWLQTTKSPGQEQSENIDNSVVTYFNNTPSNFSEILWMDDFNKQYYYILRTPVNKSLVASGLLYSSPVATYPQVKISFCFNKSNCLPQSDMIRISNFGRFFLFIQQEVDNSTVSLEQPSTSRFELLNFFVIPNYYKRVTIRFSVIKTKIFPDYFYRFTVEENVRLQVESVVQQLSVINSINASNTEAITFNMQLAPYVINNRITYQTIIDHFSLWGAFFGVLFSAFAFVFLTGNRQKFYRRNPDWNKYKEALKRLPIAQS